MRTSPSPACRNRTKLLGTSRRFPSRARVVRCKLLVNPAQLEHRIDLPDQMIRRHHLVEIKRVKELALSTLSPPHHGLLPRITVSVRRNHGSSGVSTRVLQHNPPQSGHRALASTWSVQFGTGWPNLLLRDKLPTGNERGSAGMAPFGSGPYT